jgi:hypothetical protein
MTETLFSLRTHLEAVMNLVMAEQQDSCRILRSGWLFNPAVKTDCAALVVQ